MKEIEKLLGLKPVEKSTEIEIETKVPVVIENQPTQAESDFNKARESIISVIDKANELVTTAQVIASDKEDARSFEVVNQLLNTLSAASMNLLKAQQEKKKTLGIEHNETPINGGINIQNAVFTGTTKELTELIQKQREETKSSGN